MNKNFKLVPTNDVEIQINAKSAGDFGFIKIHKDRTPQEEYRVCEEIVSEIRRHVDNVGWINIRQKQVFELSDGDQYDSLYEVLENLYDDEGCIPSYTIRYERPSDNGTGTRRTLHDFKDVITEAYKNPWKFEVQPESSALTEDQQKFLNRVIEASLNEKLVKEA